MAALTEILRLADAGCWTIQLSLSLDREGGWAGAGDWDRREGSPPELNRNLNISGISPPDE